MKLVKEYRQEYLHQTKIIGSDSVAKEMEDLRNMKKEVFVVFILNTKNAIISREIVSIGILDKVLVHAREIFRAAIVKNASSIILAHNHPSGDPEPSNDDIKITKQLVEAGKIIEIEVLDSVIVGDNNYCSLRGYRETRNIWEVN